MIKFQYDKTVELWYNRGNGGWRMYIDLENETYYLNQMGSSRVSSGAGIISMEVSRLGDLKEEAKRLERYGFKNIK